MRLRMMVFSTLILGAAFLLAACSSGGGVEKTVFVGPAMVDCEGVAPQKCLLIKEDPEGDWQLWYQPIEGFDFEEGFVYELIVEEQTVENPPADGSSIKWVLKEEVSKEPVTVKTVYIGPERVECEGEGPQTCYLYKETPDGDYGLYYDQIEGFEYEPGFNYELIVAETTEPNPPAGGSSLKLSLVEVVDKTPAPPSLLGSIMRLTSLNGQAIPENIDIVMGIAEERIGGFAGCNTYFGPYTVQGEQVKIGPLSSTRQACAEDLMSLESEYLKTMEIVDAYKVNGDQLELLNNAGGTIMTFITVEPAPLEGTLWKATTINDGQNSMVSVLPDTKATALFQEGEVNGTNSCNNYFGAYEVDGANISVGPLGSTMMACPESIMNQESIYMAALQSATSFQIVANQLQLFGENGQLLLTYQATEPISLEGTPWNIIGYNNGRGGVTSLIIGSEISLNFQEGEINGRACNQYFGPYEVDGEKISIGPLAHTEMACMEPEGVLEQELEYFAALERGTVFTIQDDRLELRDDSGALQVSAVPAEEIAE